MVGMTGSQQPVFQKQTNSPDETRRLGRMLGQTAGVDLVIALTGDLGSGKTAFTQGLARGVGVDEQWYVTSPSYTLVNEYPVEPPEKHPDGDSGRLIRLHHIDFYRLSDIIDTDDLGLDEMIAGPGIVVIEWADKFGPCRCNESMGVHFTITGETSRKLEFTAYDDRGERILSELKNRINRG